MREDLIRMIFSFLAASVTLSMAAEWSQWAMNQRSWWKLVPASVLAGFSVYEANKVWFRAERLLGL